MAYLTLLDLAKRNGSDAMIGLIEEVLTFSPEFQSLPVRPRKGTTYMATKRTGHATAAFRSINEGVTPSKSTYTQEVSQMYFLDTQMEVDESIVRGDDREIGDVLTDEGVGATLDSFNHLGSQIYYGESNDAKGFTGFVANVDSTMVVNATGTGGSTTSVWFVWENEQGVHLPIGNNGELALGEWAKQRITRDNKSLMAYVNNLSGYIGLNIGSKYSIGRVKNITATKPITDALGAELWSKFPIGRKPTKCFMNRDAHYFLQASRSAVGNVKSDRRGDAFSELPEYLSGVPIVVTDSITSSETAS